MEKKFNKRVIIYIAAAIIAVVVISVFILMSGEKGETWQEHYDLGQQYLVELSYDTAVLEFTDAIKIDPMNADAYLGLAEAYEKSGDIDKAIETLEKGFELTGDERLQARLSLLNGANEENAEVTETTTAEVTTAAEPEEVKYVNVQELEIPTDITKLMLIGPDRDDDYYYNYYFNVIVTDESYYYRLNEPLTDISFLADFKNLQSLILVLNNISDISALSGLTNLTDLCLGGNQISDISALSGLTNLTDLGLGGNQISDISALSGLTNLTDLDLHANQISDINALSGLTNLTVLDLWRNQISDISALSGLTNLTELSLFGNQISDADIKTLRSALPSCTIN